ncbi:MAG: glycosyltransferase, partial [bacterium]
MDISFLIVNYGTPDLVNRLVDSIYKFNPSGDSEIIVVDNKSPDNSVEIIRSANPDIRLVAHEKNVGFGAGNNRGAGFSSGQTLILVNSDCVLKEECFDKPVRFLNENP